MPLARAAAMLARCLGLLGVVGFVVSACGGSTSSDASGSPSGGAGGTTSSGGSAGTLATGGAGAGGTGGGGPTPSACAVAADALASKLGGAAASCTVAVRLSAPSLTLLDYAVTCGAYAALDEAGALQRVKTDTGYIGGCTDPNSLTGPSPNDEFVFFQPASLAACACCGDGWVAAVGVRNGLTVFGSGISVGGPPAKDYPSSWSPASELGSNCPSSVPRPQARGFDLTVMLGAPPPPLDDAAVQAALGAVWSTALPLAYAQKQYVFDAVVLRTIGSIQDNGFPDYVVLVNSGWLE